MSAGDAVASAAAQLVVDISARAVVLISSRGMTASTICAARPDAPVIAISADPLICRRLQLLWGAIPIYDQSAGAAHPNAVARQVAQQLGLAASGQFIVLVRGFHADPEINSPSITLLAL